MEKTAGMDKEALKAVTADNLSPLISKMTPRAVAGWPFALMGMKSAEKFDKHFNRLFQALTNLKKRGKWNKIWS